MKKTLTILLALVLVVSMLAGCETTVAPAADAAPAASGERTEKLVLSFPEINAETDNACLFLKEFARMVSERTNGMIEINVFGGGQLGNEAECIEGLGLGTYAFFRINPANLKNRGIDIPEYSALGLPFLFQSVEGGLQFLYSDYGHALADQVYEKSGGTIRSLYHYICTPARNMLTKVKCTSLEDFKKLKIRSETSDIKIDMINCWASATPLAMSEIYTSLSSGVLDGCENTFAGMKNNNWYEQAKYVYQTEHVIGSSVILVSEAVWQQLSESERTIIDESMKEACEWFQQKTIEDQEPIIQFLKDAGVEITPCTDKEAWIASCAPLYAKYAASVAEDFISTIQSYK